MKLHQESHVDHVPESILYHVLGRFRDRGGFFAETFDLPEGLPALALELHGPAVGDDPVPEYEVEYQKRGDRPYRSRMTLRKSRTTRQCTVIAGPHRGDPCVLYTVFGGPKAPKEPGDPTIKSESERLESEAFWAEHALSE